MLADAPMKGTMTTDKYPHYADLLENVGVKAMKVSEPTTTLSALLGSLGGMVFFQNSPHIAEFHASSAVTIQMLLSLPGSRARGLGGIRRCFPRFTVLQGLEILPAILLNASSIFGKNDLCPDVDQNADRCRICFL